MTNKKLTQKQAVKRLQDAYPNGTDLIYIDYRDSFDESKELMQELAQTGYLDSFWETSDWLTDSEYESIDYIIKEIFDESEQEQINDDTNLREAIVDYLLEHNTSTPETDLLKNTSRRFYYYDLGLECDSQYVREFMCDYDKNNEVAIARAIAKKLRIQYKKHEKNLLELVGNAGYGGQLVILFVAKPLDLFGKRGKYITFEDDFEICIMDRGNGSGYSLKMDIKPTLKFIPENLNDDEGASGYSFSGDVCGLCKSSFNDAQFDWSNKLKKSTKLIEVEENEEAKAFAEREKKYQKTYQEGKCTFGDTDIRRHRNTAYINNIPCGNKCKDCGQFWID